MLNPALLIVAMILILGGALSAPPKIKIIAGLSNALNPSQESWDLEFL
jgi:hypothetical protein